VTKEDARTVADYMKAAVDDIMTALMLLDADNEGGCENETEQSQD
jgi:hypothetical protein